MSDQTPRVPELWWSASEKALWEKDNDGYFCPDYYPIRSGKELPADAVKLGDVEALQARLDKAWDDGDVLAVRAVSAERKLSKFRAELAVEWGDDEAWEDWADERLENLRAIAEGETR